MQLSRADIIRLFQVGLEHVHSKIIVLAARLAERQPGGVSELLRLALIPQSSGKKSGLDSQLLANSLDYLMSDGFERDVRSLLDHPEAWVREGVAISCGRWDSKESPFLTAYEEALIALALGRENSGRKHGLVRLLVHDDYHIRQDALKRLQRYDDKYTTEYLVDELQLMFSECSDEWLTYVGALADPRFIDLLVAIFLGCPMQGASHIVFRCRRRSCRCSSASALQRPRRASSSCSTTIATKCRTSRVKRSPNLDPSRQHHC